MTLEKMFRITHEYGYDGRIGFGKEVANLRCFKSPKGFRTIHTYDESSYQYYCKSYSRN